LTLNAFGVAASVKLGGTGAVTVRLSVTVCVKVPDVPVMVTVEVPVVAVLLAVNVSVLLVVTPVAGLNAAVTPAGSPVATRLTLPVKPLISEREIAVVPVPLCPTLKVVGERAMTKSGLVEPAAGASVAMDV